MVTSARSDGMSVEVPVPVLQVADVQRSMTWYADVLGFRGDAFPERPPHAFAILRRDAAEIMLQRSGRAGSVTPTAGWSVYLRVRGGRLLHLAQAISSRQQVVRGPERAFYGQVEFEVRDPDGHLICLAEALPADVDVPLRQE